MNRSNVVLVIVVVVAIAVASVVAVHGHSGAGTTALSAYGAENPSAAGLADTSNVASSTGSGATAVDPAKQDPTLDQFTSRDPFIQVTTAPSVGVPTAEPTATSTPVPKPTAADIHIAKKGGGVNTTYTAQKVGAKLPPSAAVFKITAISASGVTFELLNGYSVGGSKTFGPIAQSSLPTDVMLQNGAKQTDYYVTVLRLDYAGSSGSGSGSGSGGTSGSTSYAVGHAIKALSIETRNGVPGATIVVDGTTFAAKKVGDVLTTSWGQIKIIGINGPAQTVTILHADVQVTLHVGQSVSK